MAAVLVSRASTPASALPLNRRVGSVTGSRRFNLPNVAEGGGWPYPRRGAASNVPGTGLAGRGGRRGARGSVLGVRPRGAPGGGEGTGNPWPVAAPGVPSKREVPSPVLPAELRRRAPGPEAAGAGARLPSGPENGVVGFPWHGWGKRGAAHGRVPRRAGGPTGSRPSRRAGRRRGGLREVTSGEAGEVGSLSPKAPATSRQANSRRGGTGASNAERVLCTSHHPEWRGLPDEVGPDHPPRRHPRLPKATVSGGIGRAPLGPSTIRPPGPHHQCSVYAGGFARLRAAECLTLAGSSGTYTSVSIGFSRAVKGDVQVEMSPRAGAECHETHIRAPPRSCRGSTRGKDHLTSPGFALLTCKDGGLVRTALNEPSSVRASEVVRYEAGYVVCAVIAGLFLLVVPTVGLCFCCCRCRRRCGGRVKAERKSLACERGCLMACLLLTTLVLLAGAVCALVTNQRTHEEMEPGLGAVPDTLRALQRLVSEVPQELEAVARRFRVPQRRVLAELDDVGENLGASLHAQLQATVYRALATVRNTGQALQVSLRHLQAVNASSGAGRERQGALESALRQHRDRLLPLLGEARCSGCAEALRLARGLELGANFSQVPSVEDVSQQLKGVPEANFTSLALEENSTFNALPILASVQTARVVHDLKKALDHIPEEVASLSRGFPGSEAAGRWSRALEEAENGSRPYLREVQRCEQYRWILSCILCSVLLLIVLCNLLGLALGAWGLAAREDSSQSEAKGECGARCLMAGVGLSFLFSGPFILLVFATFLPGGNVQTLLCRSWESHELYQFVDTPGNLPPSVNLSRLLGLKRDVSVASAYQQCKAGAALWEVLQLNGSYDLERHLDVSQYTAKLQKDLRELQVDVKELDLLNAAARRDLTKLQASGLDHIDYPGFLAQIQRPVVNTDVVQLAGELERLSQAQSDSALGQQLETEGRALLSLHQNQVVLQEASLAELNSSVRILSASAPKLQVAVVDTLANVTFVKTEVTSRANQILRNESECFLNRQLDYFSQYLSWVRQTVTQQIATCKPLSRALDNAQVILCDLIADPWNAFWFCLAWCTFLLIPSMIFAIKMTKHFRPIRKRLSSTSSEETQLFHIPRVTSLKL
ncbi:prominin-2 [Ornithorhynchus anatinus]|uniref:prominin-2 n=1 Tax=Ornithorhynchus anatinus TaxID=9258 RepID=UPI0019D4A958|nr:prominin-2 [Ornithorhynchus anatinus]